MRYLYLGHDILIALQKFDIYGVRIFFKFILLRFGGKTSPWLHNLLKLSPTEILFFFKEQTLIILLKEFLSENNLQDIVSVKIKIMCSSLPFVLKNKAEYFYVLIVYA